MYAVPDDGFKNPIIYKKNYYNKISQSPKAKANSDVVDLVRFQSGKYEHFRTFKKVAKVDTMLMELVFPAPLGPRMPKHSPLGTARENPLTAYLGGLPSLAGYTFFKLSHTIGYAVVGLAARTFTCSTCN